MYILLLFLFKKNPLHLVSDSDNGICNGCFKIVPETMDAVLCSLIKFEEMQLNHIKI